METRPVQSVGILWGEGTNTQPGYDLRDLSQAFSGPETSMVWQVGDGLAAPEPDDVKEMFSEIAHPAAGRSLIVMVLDGRMLGMNRQIRQPLRTAPFYNNPAQYLGSLASAMRVRSPRHPPVDVFLLLSQRTNLRPHVRYFPSNSTLIALKTPVRKPATAWFRHLASHKANPAPWPVAPGAKELLLDYMLSGGEFIPARKIGNFRWPAVAVRDHYPSPDMNDVWHSLTQLNPIDVHSDQVTRERLLTLQDARGYDDAAIEGAIDALGRRRIPAKPAHYAGMLLAGRHKLFGLDASWQWLDDLMIAGAVDDRQTELDLDLSEPDPLAVGHGELTAASVRAIIEADASVGRSAEGGALPPTSGKSARTRFSATQLAGLPPTVRRLAQLAPVTVRRLLPR